MPLCSSCSVNIFTPRVVADLPGLHNKLRTEYGPAFVQPDEVTSILQDIQRDIEDYETKSTSLVSPCRKIPNEILQEIFDLCCDMNTFRVVDPAHRVPMHESQALRSKPAMAISSSARAGGAMHFHACDMVSDIIGMENECGARAYNAVLSAIQLPQSVPALPNDGQA
ncbi:hypothetical protein BDP27DRAFT_1439776 [Rhodocollybia butyracea]|uniref:Uncharacterized protein n=1 Tax=Rhodocollybia butyracea TaxID=206335 RepID=A0A9P5P015_9AGAR|nr:hypothetical protein BDP27DRAFT_1439776 [Rhodocollybia butyracea]